MLPVLTMLSYVTVPACPCMPYSGSAFKRKWAARVAPLVTNPHWLLVSLVSQRQFRYNAFGR